MIVKYLKQTGKHSIIYGIGSLVSKIIAFILIPIYTRVLTPAEYGVLSLMLITINISTILFSFGLQTALFRFYIFDYTTKKERKSLISTIVFFLIFFLTGFISLLVYYAENISVLFFGTSEFTYYFRLIFLTSFFEVGAIIALSILRSQSRSKLYSILVISRFIIQISLIIYFVVILNQGVEGALKGLLYSFMLFFIINLPIIIKNINFSFSITKLKKILRFSIPLIPAAISSWILTMIDRFILEKFLGTTTVGTYTLGYNIGMIINFLFVAPLQLAWAQIKWTILKKEDDAKKIFSYFLTYYSLLGSLVFVGLTLLSGDIIKIISTDVYYEAASIVPYISLSYLFFGIYFMVNIGINIKKKTEYAAIILALSAIVNITLNYALIPSYGINGAAFATLISYLILLILSLMINNRLYKIRYQWVRLGKIASSVLIILLINAMIPDLNLISSIIIRSILSLCLFIILYFFNFFEKREIRKIWEFIRDKNKLKLLKG